MPSGIKSIRNLWIPGIILLVLIALLIAVVFIGRDSNTLPSETDSSAPYTRLSPEVNDIRSLSVMKENQPLFSIIRNPLSGDAFRFSFANSELNNDERYFSDSEISELVTHLSEVRSNRSVSSEGRELSEFGLSSPLFTVSFESKTGEIVCINIGNKSPDKESVYVHVNNTGPVYLISAEYVDLMDVKATDLFDHSGLVISATEISRIRFHRKADNFYITAVPDDLLRETGYDGGFKIIEPIEYNGGDAFNRLAFNLLSITIDGYIGEGMGKFSDYGLDDPQYEYTIEKSDGSSVTVYFSEERSGNYFGYSDFLPGIFYIESNRISGNGMKVALIDCYYPYPLQLNISDIKRIISKFPEGDFTIDIDISSDSNFSDSETEIVLNGRDAKVRDGKGQYYFSLLYYAITEMRFSRIDPNQKMIREPDISIQIVYRNDEITLLEFSELTSGEYMVIIDHEYSGFIISSVEMYDGTDENPGVWYSYRLLSKALDGQINGTYDISVP